MYYIPKDNFQNLINFKSHHFKPFPLLCSNPIHLSQKQINQLDTISSLTNSCCLAVFPYLTIFCVYINCTTTFTITLVASGKSCHSWKETQHSPTESPTK